MMTTQFTAKSAPAFARNRRRARPRRPGAVPRCPAAGVGGASSRERGLALVVVMGTAAVAAVMAAHVMLISETVARESVVASDRNQLRYACEGAADRAFWHHLVDRRLFTNRMVGSRNVQREAYPEPPWMLDGNPHFFADLGCVVALHDAERGIDFSGSEPGAELRDQVNLEDVDRVERVKIFLNIAADYVDADDQYRVPGGMERPDYEMAGYPTLPRNGPLEFREEVYWLPGWRDVLYGQVKMLPPEGLSFPKKDRSGRRPPFFSSAPTVIQERLDLTQAELEQVLEARDLWRRDGIPLNETLAADIVGKIRARFSLVESGVVTIETQAAARNGAVNRRMTMTRAADLTSADVTVEGKEAWALWYRQLR